MEAAEGKETIASEAKKRAPPTAVSCCLVDHANARTLQNIFDKLISSKDDAMVEKVAHTMGLHCRLHNQTLMEVAMPLVKKLSKGGELGDAMQAKLLELEALLETVDKSKKHLDNTEFIEAMQKKKQAENELMAMAENDVLPAMQEELDADELVKAAEQMEVVKNKAPLLPQVQAAA